MKEMITLTQEQLKELLQIEREICAKIAEKYEEKNPWSGGKEIAKKIRREN